MGIVDLRKKQARFLPTRTRGFSRRAEKPVPLRKKRARVRVFAAFLFLLLCAASVYGLHLVSYHPRISIQSIHVEGASAVSVPEVEASVRTILEDQAWTFFSRKNLISYPKEDIVAGILHEFPRVKSVTVGRESSLSQTLAVAITERQPYARWCSPSSTCFLMDESGYIFAGAASSSTHSPYVFWGAVSASSSPIGQTFLPDYTPKIISMLDLLKEGGYPAEEIIVVSNEDFLIDLNQGYVLKVSFNADPHELIRNLQLVLGSSALKSKKSSLEYIDLRFGNRVYYKMKGDGAVQQAD